MPSSSLLLLDKEEIHCIFYNVLEPHLFDQFNYRLLLLFNLKILVENNGSSFSEVVPFIKFQLQLFLVHLTFGQHPLFCHLLFFYAQFQFLEEQRLIDVRKLLRTTNVLVDHVSVIIFFFHMHWDFVISKLKLLFSLLTHNILISLFQF